MSTQRATTMTYADLSDLEGDELRTAIAEILAGDSDDDDKRQAALLDYLLDSGEADSSDDVSPAGYGDNTFDGPGRAEYRVLTDDEADDAAADYIKDSVWAFRPEFLSGETGIDEMVFEALADKCEGANDAILSIIKGSCGIDDFVETAIGADGRGHFLAGYDNEENESGEYFIYRVN